MGLLDGPIKAAGNEVEEVGKTLLAAGTADLANLLAVGLMNAADYKVVFTVSLERKVPVGPVEPGQ